LIKKDFYKHVALAMILRYEKKGFLNLKRCVKGLDESGSIFLHDYSSLRIYLDETFFLVCFFSILPYIFFFFLSYCCFLGFQ